MSINNTKFPDGQELLLSPSDAIASKKPPITLVAQSTDDVRKIICPISCMTAGDLRKKDVPPHEYYLGNVIHSQTYMQLSADRGTGKSSFARCIYTCLATGKDCLKWTNHKPDGLKVLIIDGEMDLQTIKGRHKREYETLSESEKNLFDDNVFIKSKDDFGDGEFPFFDENPAYWLDLIEQNNIDVVIADNMSCLIKDQSKTNDVQMFKTFDEKFSFPLRKRRKAFINIFHEGKDTSKGARGSSASGDHTNVGISLEKYESMEQEKKDNPYMLGIKIKFTKFREERTPDTDPFIALYKKQKVEGVDKEIYQWSIKEIHVSNKENVKTKWESSIEYEPCKKPSISKIAREIGIDESTVREYLQKIERDYPDFQGPSKFKPKKK